VNITQKIFGHSPANMHHWRNAMGALTLVGLTTLSAFAAPKQQSFATPQDGAQALAQAVKTDNQSALRSIFGADASKLINSGDPVADARNREKFIQAYGEANEIVLTNETHAELQIGKDNWPMPIPLVKSKDSRWRFDPQRGEAEIISRRIGRNELAAIQACLAIVDAQNEFAARDPDADGLHEFASRFTSTNGKRDGLYWPTQPDEALSPLGPLLASAAKDGYLKSGAQSLEPYQGYFYRILTKQGKSAPGGAYDYFVKRQMMGGFALVAYPARYGASGIMSFIVSQDGVVYQKNLGRYSARLASRIKAFDPDASWMPIHQ